MDQKYGCRKFILALFLSAVASCALFARIISGGEFCSIVGLVFGIYGTADVTTKKHKIQSGSVE